MSYTYPDWLRGWKEWARTRKRGRMAQFIIEKLEEGKQAQWLSISKGMFELTEWHSIAKEWFGEKPRNSEEVDAPCMLRKGLPRAFPGLEEVKERSRKEGTQYRSRVFQAPLQLLQEVILHMTNHHDPTGYTSESYIAANASGYTQYRTESFATIPSTVSAHYYQPTPYMSSVKLEYSPSAGIVCNPQVIRNGDHYQQQHPTQAPYSSQTTEIERIANAIADESMDTQYHNSATPPNNGWQYTQSNDTSSLSINSYTHSPVPQSVGYHHSPSSMHSPHISPEPSVLSAVSSYPSSVDVHHAIPTVSNGPVLSPSNVHSPIIVTDEQPPEVMEVKPMPNNSPLEGGGQMALVFYKTLPQGSKYVYFVSTTNPSYFQVQPAIDENPHTLSCTIPKYPLPEEVELRVYCDQQPIASTMFTYYHQLMPPSDLLLQILNSQLQSHFPINQGGMGSTSSGSAGQASGGASYPGYIPSSMYQLLLGACRMGCEPLVYCLLCSPAMEDVSLETIEKAQACAEENGHTQLAEHLLEIRILHEMTLPAGLICREPEHIVQGVESVSQFKHVPAYYDAIDQLDQGGDTPQERAETVMKQLLEAMSTTVPVGTDINKKEVEQETEETASSQADEPTPTTDNSFPLINEQLAENEQNSDETSSNTLATPTNENGGRRRLSSNNLLKRQSKSISDEDEEIVNLKPILQHSRASWCESADVVGDLPHNNTHKKHPFSQHSDADSAIGMSFEEDSMSSILSDVRRRSSLLTDITDVNYDTFSINLPQQAGIEVANSLHWESAIIVTEDYPPSQDKKIFNKGDQIVKVGDHLIRNMPVEEFGDLFQQLATAGTNITIKAYKNSQPLDSAPPTLRPLKRVPSDQSMLTNKINQLLNAKPTSTTERHVTIPWSAQGYGIKVMGGKNVGVFILEVRSDVTQLNVGDQVLSINGKSTTGQSLYDTTQLLQSTAEEELNLIVIENIAKFSSIREQVELDSFFIRSLVDHSPHSNREMTLKKDSLLRVVNTSAYTNYWLAWSVDEISGTEMLFKRIPNPQSAVKQFGRPVYERVNRHDVSHKRPICVIGKLNDELTHFMSSKSEFKICKNVEDVLETCSKGFQHGVLSVSDVKDIKLLSALNPIVCQTSVDHSITRIEQEYHYNVDVLLTGEKTSDLAKRAIDEVARVQSQPIWKTIGVI